MFYDFPAMRWQGLQTPNPIEATFGTIRHEATSAEGLICDGMLHMMLKLWQCGEENWLCQHRFQQFPKILEGIQIVDGIKQSVTDTVAT